MDGTGEHADNPGDASARPAEKRRPMTPVRIALGVVEGVAVLAIALAGVIALLLFFEGRDASTAGSGGGDAASEVRGPGVADPAATSSLLRRGNVELRYARAADRNALVALGERIAGPDTSELRSAGVAVVVRRDPRAQPITAVAYERRLPASSVRDPNLQAFVEAWLGQSR